MCCIKKKLYLHCFKANAIPDGAAVYVVLLIRMHVENVHDLVGLDGALEEEDEKGTGAANLQVGGHKARNCFVN